MASMVVTWWIVAFLHSGRKAVPWVGPVEFIALFHFSQVPLLCFQWFCCYCFDNYFLRVQVLVVVLYVLVVVGSGISRMTTGFGRGSRGGDGIYALFKKKCDPRLSKHGNDKDMTTSMNFM